MSQASPTVSIVAPAYNEEAGIAAFIEAVSSELRHIDGVHEIIVVDDGSSDNTWEALSQLIDTFSADGSVRLRCLRLSRNFGKESALSAGIEKSEGRSVIIMDTDMQHPPELIPRMVCLWRDSHVDVVEALKSSRGNDGLARGLGSRLFYSLFRVFSGYDLKGSSDYKLLDRRVVNALLEMGERNLFFRGMIEWLGFQRCQLTFGVPERIGGTSGWSKINLAKMAIEAITAYSSVPLRLVAAAGILFLAGSIVLAGYTLVYKLLGLAVSGFTTVILLQLFIGSICMLSIGMIGEYVGRVYDETKRRPRYIIVSEIVSEDTGGEQAKP